MTAASGNRVNIVGAKVALRSGAQIPRLGLGTWLRPEASDRDQCAETVRCALAEHQYRHIDTAAVYNSHGYVAEGIKKSGVPREDIWITTKIWNTNQRYADAVAAIDQCLKELETTYIDLLLIHWNVALDAKDGSVVQTEKPLFHETWKAMEEAKKAGKVRHIGVSNFGVRSLKALMAEATEVPEMNQIERHPYLAQRELAEFCKSHGITVTAYSPFGNLNRQMGKDCPLLVEDPVIVDIANAHKVSPQCIVLSWHFFATEGCFIPKTTSTGHLGDNAHVVQLTADDLMRLNDLNKGQRYCIPPWKVEHLFD